MNYANNRLLIIGFILACFVLQSTKINAQSLEREEVEIEKSPLLDDNDSVETSVVIPNSIKPKPSDDDGDDGGYEGDSEEEESKPTDDPHTKHRDRAFNRAMARIDRRKERFEEKMKRKRARLERRRIRLERSAAKYFELLEQQVEKAQNKADRESTKKIWSKLRQMIGVLKRLMDKNQKDSAGGKSSSSLSAAEKNLEEEVDKEISRFQTKLEELGNGKHEEPVINQV